jgi:hypothetical protein
MVWLCKGIKKTVCGMWYAISGMGCEKTAAGKRRNIQSLLYLFDYKDIVPVKSILADRKSLGVSSTRVLSNGRQRKAIILLHYNLSSPLLFIQENALTDAEVYRFFRYCQYMWLIGLWATSYFDRILSKMNTKYYIYSPI